MELHGRIKKIRKNIGLSQHKMAKSLNISLSAYQYYERGEREPSAKFISDLSTTYEVEPAWLLLGKGSMHPGPRKGELGDLSSIKEIIIGVEEELREKKKTLAPRKKAELIVLIYELLLKDQTPLKQKERKAFIREHALKFLRLVT